MGIIEENLPSLPQFGGENLWIILTWIFVVFIILIGVGIGLWFYINKKLFNKKIVLFEDVSGKGLEPTFKDKAKLVKIGNQGEEVLYLKKKKVYRVAYGKKISKDTYWFVAGPDGYWYDFVLGDLDRESHEAGIKFTATNMRYAYTSIESKLKERYDDKTWWDKYGNWILSISFIAVIGVFAFLIIREYTSIMSASTKAMELSKEVTAEIRQLVGSLHNLKSGGSGLESAVNSPGG